MALRFVSIPVLRKIYRNVVYGTSDLVYFIFLFVLFLRFFFIIYKYSFFHRFIACSAYMTLFVYVLSFWSILFFSCSVSVTENASKRNTLKYWHIVPVYIWALCKSGNSTYCFSMLRSELAAPMKNIEVSFPNVK